MVADAEDPEPAGLAGRRGEPRAAHPAHAGLDDRILRCRTDRRARVCSAGAHAAELLLPEPRRIDHLADQAQLLGGGRARLSELVGNDESKAGRSSTTSSTRDARDAASEGASCGRASRSRRRPGSLTTRRISWKRGACAPSARGAVVADAGHDVDAAPRTTRGRMVRDRSSWSGWLMVLPGAPRMPSSCALGRRRVADAGDVLIAEAIDLRRAHHDVAPARPDDVEDRAVGQLAFDDLRVRVRPSAGTLRHEARDAVGQQQIRARTWLGEARADGGE